MIGFRNIAVRFARDEDGAVTVDWVVLTAAIVSLGMLVVAALTGSMGQLTTRAANHVSSMSISSSM